MKRASNREKKIKVVHLARRYAPMIGGVEKHVTELNNELLKRDYKLTVICEQSKPELETFEIVDDVVVCRLPVCSENAGSNFLEKLKFKLKLWRSLWSLRAVLFSADIIQIHDVFFWIMPFWVFIYKKLHITFHGYKGNNKSYRIQAFWYQLASRLTRSNLCIGGFHKKWFGISADESSFGAVEFEGLDKSHRPLANSLATNKITQKSHFSKRKVAFVGRLELDTGISSYLQAWKIIQKTHPKVQLDIYGDGQLMEQSKQFASQNNLRVNFHGFSKNLEKILPAYDLIFTSGYLAIIESLVLGKPVIAYYGTEIKKDYLTLTPFAKWIDTVDSPESIASTTQAFFKNPPVKKLLQAQKWAQAQTWSALADVYEQLWHK